MRCVVYITPIDAEAVTAEFLPPSPMVTGVAHVYRFFRTTGTVRQQIVDPITGTVVVEVETFDTFGVAWAWVREREQRLTLGRVH